MIQNPNEKHTFCVMTICSIVASSWQYDKGFFIADIAIKYILSSNINTCEIRNSSNFIKSHEQDK